MEDWSNATKKFVEEIFQESIGVYDEDSGLPGCAYLKIICRMKKELFVLLDNLKKLSGVDGKVLAFVKSLCENLDSLEDAEYYMAIYVRETMQHFSERIRFNDPHEFLNVFPATHQFTFCQVLRGTRKDFIRCTTYAREAFMAVLLENKLGDVHFSSGHFLNSDICGYWDWYGCGKMTAMENVTFISYKLLDDGRYIPLVVHHNLEHIF